MAQNMYLLTFQHFTARRVGIAQTMPWQNVCPSACPSVTRRYSVQTDTHMLKVLRRRVATLF